MGDAETLLDPSRSQADAGLEAVIDQVDRSAGEQGLPRYPSGESGSGRIDSGTDSVSLATQ